VNGQSIVPENKGSIWHRTFTVDSGNKDVTNSAQGASGGPGGTSGTSSNGSSTVTTSTRSSVG
jgi:hypothetical protein